MKQEKREFDVPYIPMTKEKFDLLGMMLTDPMGSYTGRPVDPLDTPVQDADDL